MSSLNPAETLRILFAMDQSEIDRDLKNAEGRQDEVAAELTEILMLDQEAITPVTDARRAHLLMVQACELIREGAFPMEMTAFYASYATNFLAGDAWIATANKGTLAEISGRLRTARASQQATGDPGENVEQLEAEYERMVDSIGDTVIPFLLRRYGLHERADLFEQDRTIFEMQHETGRRIVCAMRPPSPEMDQQLDDLFATRFGDEALAHVKARVEELLGE